LHFVSDEPLFDILSRSRTVIGFNTTALLEGLFTPAHLIVPYWGDARRERYRLLIDPSDEQNRSVFTFPETPDALQESIESTLQSAFVHTDLVGRKEVLSGFFHYDEAQTCSGEVEGFIRHFVAASHLHSSGEGRHLGPR
jgi:hypothetical protein